MDFQSEANNYPTAQNKAVNDPYTAHQIAVSNWHVACKDYARAAEQREQCRIAAQKALEALSEHIQRNSQDPTVPQQEMPMPPNGGMLGKY